MYLGIQTGYFASAAAFLLLLVFDGVVVVSIP